MKAIIVSILVSLFFIILPAGDTILSRTLLPTPLTSKAVQPASTLSKGETLIEERCTSCHGVDQIKSADRTPNQWKLTVERMVINYGAKLSGEERYTILQFLSGN